MEDLAGRVAVVTGAASGIGAGLARCLAREGMRLVLADVEDEPARKLADELLAAGGRAVAVETDVADPAAVEALADRAFAAFGAVHLLCNNAGVCQGGPVHEMTAEDWEWLWSVNVGGVVNGCRTFVPRLVAQGGPSHIVNTASIGGFVTGGELGLYSTTKYAVVGYSEALAQDVARHGIGVTVLCPGWTNTRLGEAARNRPAGHRGAPAKMDAILAGMAAGLDPLEVGRHAVRGVRENALYVFTHADLAPVVEARFDAVRAALERARERPWDRRGRRRSGAV